MFTFRIFALGLSISIPAEPPPPGVCDCHLRQQSLLIEDTEFWEGYYKYLSLQKDVEVNRITGAREQ